MSDEPITGEYDAINFDGLERRANYRTIAYREDMLHVFGRRDAAAIIYHIIYRWQTDYKRADVLKEIERRKAARLPALTPEEVENRMWVYMSYNDFVRESGQAVAYNTVIRTLHYLIHDIKVIEQRDNHDPHYPDYEYRINKEVAKTLLKALPAEPAFTPKIPKKKEKSTHLGRLASTSTQMGTADTENQSTHLGTGSTQNGIASTHLGTEVYPNGGTSQITTQYPTENNTEEEREGEQEASATIASPHVDAAPSDYPLITFADCLTYLQQQGTPARSDDAVQIMVQARTLYASQSFPIANSNTTTRNEEEDDALVDTGTLLDRDPARSALDRGWQAVGEVSDGKEQEIARTCATCGRPQTQADCPWCMTTRLPAIPKTPSLSPAVEPGRSGGPTPGAPAPLPGGTSHEQNRDASPGSVAVGCPGDRDKVGPGADGPAPIPPVPSGSSPPRTMRATVVTCPPDRVPAPPKWDAQAMVARAEALRDKPFSESARPKETRSARKLFARKPDLTEEEFTGAFQHWNTPWWRETNGLFCITDLAAVPKNKSEMRLIIALEKLALPRSENGGQVLSMTRGSPRVFSSYDDPNFSSEQDFEASGGSYAAAI